MKYTKYPELKSELKQLAKDIRKWKNLRKWDNRFEYNRGREHKIQLWNAEHKVREYKYAFRHKHIAYCLLRGRTYEQIEQKTNTPPNDSYIESIKEKYEQETLRVSA